MAIEATMGLKKIYVAASTSSTEMPANGASTWADLGDVYKDTCTLKDTEPDVTEHESETSNKKITITGESSTEVELTLMDPSLELLAKYFGGTIEGSSPGQKKWIRPKKLPYKEFAVWLQPEEGLMIGCPNCRIIPRFEITYSSKGICLVPMKIKFNAELHSKDENKSPNVG